MTPRNPKSKTARIYCRVSTQKQGVSGLGLEAQEKIGRKKAKELGLKVVEVVVEVESGRKSRRGRPVLMKALNDCKDDKSALICASISRLARNFNFMIKLTEAAERDGIGIVACDVPDLDREPTPMNKFMWRLMANLAELEADQTSERTKAALAAAQDRGVKLGAPDSKTASKQGRKALQYDTIKYAKDTVMPAIKDIEKIGIVGLRAIARELNARHVPTYQAYLMDIDVSLRGKRDIDEKDEKLRKEKREKLSKRPIWRAQTVKQALQNAEKPLPKVKSRQAGK